MRERTKMAVAFLVCALLFPQCLRAYEKEIASLSASAAEQITKSGKKSVAVVDFVDLDGKPGQLGRFLAEEFSVALSLKAAGFEVFDRTQLKALLKEHGLATTGLIDPATAKKLGKLAGVEALVTGTYTPFGESIRLSVKVLDTETAKVLGAASGEIPRTQGIERLLENNPESAASGDTSGLGPSRQVRPAPPLAAPTPTPVGEVEAEETVFRPIGCRAVSSRVMCAVLVTNERSAVRTFHVELLNGGILLIDDLGGQYQPQEGALGGLRRAASWGYLEVNLPPGVPMRLELTFAGLDPGAKSASLGLRVAYVGTGNWSNVTIRGLEILR